MTPFLSRRLWQQLFPDATVIYDLVRWHDPAPDTQHLGLSLTVSERLWDTHARDMEGVICDLARHVARGRPLELQFGLVCRSVSLYVVVVRSSRRRRRRRRVVRGT